MTINPQLDNIPPELRQHKAWLVWRYEANKDPDKKPLKVPYYAITGRRRAGAQGSAADRAELVSFEEAVSVFRNRRGYYTGIGFATLAEWGVVGLDFDNCVSEDGAVDLRVLEVVGTTYSEVSPSGRGVRAFVMGRLPDRKSVGPAAGAVEGEKGFGFETFHTKGFLTVTGAVTDVYDLAGVGVEPLDVGVGELYEARFGSARLAWQAEQARAARLAAAGEAGAGGVGSAGTGLQSVLDLGVLTSALRTIADAVNAGKQEMGRNTWRDVLFGVGEATGWSAEGWEVAHEFSKAVPDYGPEALDEIWEGGARKAAAGVGSDDGGGAGAKITDATVRHMARKWGWVDPTLAPGDGAFDVVPFDVPPAWVTERERSRSAAIGREGEHLMPTQRVMEGVEMLENLVFLAEGSQVTFLHEPRFVLPLPEMKNWLAGSVAKVADSKRSVHLVDSWLKSPGRKSVRTRTFAPGRGIVCEDPKGSSALNLWRPRAGVAPDGWEALAAPFFEHVAYLVPDASERSRFLDWLAHIEQSPGVLPHTHYLLVAKQTGIGRNWLAYALARCFAGHTALGFNLSECLSKGFNDELSQSLLAVVDELHEGGPGGSNRQGAEKLKSMLTESTRLINPKYGRRHTEFNSCRFLMFSNHEAALPLSENDRRVIVIENPTTRRGEAYYAHLYAMLETPGFGAALAEAFRQRDISGFNPGAVAPMNAAKGRTIRAGRSEVEAAVRDVAAEWPSDCITSARLQHAVAEALGGKSWSTQGACVNAGLVKYKGRVKVSGIASHVWVLRSAREWEIAAPGAVASEVQRGEAALEGDELS